MPMLEARKRVLHEQKEQLLALASGIKDALDQADRLELCMIGIHLNDALELVLAELTDGASPLEH